MNSNLYKFDYRNSSQQEEVKEVIPVDARFVRTEKTGDKVYLLDNGKKFWITSAEVLDALGGGFDEVKTIDFKVLQSYASGEPLNMGNLPKDIPGKKEVLDPGNPSPHPEEVIQLKAHEEPTPDSAPKEEPEVGFTSIIIPAYLLNYPIFHMLGNCIGSIREHTDKEKTPYEIILVLNGNEDAVKFQSLQETLADKIIVNEENKGYAYAVNQGIRCAKGEYIAVINDDVLVYDHWLEDMQEALEQIDLIMATPMYGRAYARAIEAEELRQKSIIRKFLVDGKEIDVNTLLAKQGGLIQVNEVQDVKEIESNIKDTFSDFIDFSCILTRKELFDEIGLFNEDFFMYGEDLDFMRIMKKANKTYASTKRVNTTHIIQGTANYVEGMAEVMNKSKEKLKEIWGY